MHRISFFLQIACVVICGGCRSGLYRVITTEDEKPINSKLDYYIQGHEFGVEIADDAIYDESKIPVEVLSGFPQYEDDKTGISTLLCFITLGIFPLFECENVKQDVTVRTPLGERSGAYYVEAKRWSGWLPIFVGYPALATTRTSLAELPNEEFEAKVRDGLVAKLVGQYTVGEWRSFAKKANQDRKSEMLRIDAVRKNIETKINAGEFDAALQIFKRESLPHKGGISSDEDQWTAMSNRIFFVMNEKKLLEYLHAEEYDEAIKFCCDNDKNGGKLWEKLISSFDISRIKDVRNQHYFVEMINNTSNEAVICAIVQGCTDENVLYEVARKRPMQSKVYFELAKKSLSKRCLDSLAEVRVKIEADAKEKYADILKKVPSSHEGFAVVARVNKYVIDNQARIEDTLKSLDDGQKLVFLRDLWDALYEAIPYQEQAIHFNGRTYEIVFINPEVERLFEEFYTQVSPDYLESSFKVSTAINAGDVVTPLSALGFHDDEAILRMLEKITCDYSKYRKYSGCNHFMIHIIRTMLIRRLRSQVKIDSAGEKWIDRITDVYRYDNEKAPLDESDFGRYERNVWLDKMSPLIKETMAKRIIKTANKHSGQLVVVRGYNCLMPRKDIAVLNAYYGVNVKLGRYSRLLGESGPYLRFSEKDRFKIFETEEGEFEDDFIKKYISPYIGSSKVYFKYDDGWNVLKCMKLKSEVKYYSDGTLDIEMH